MFFQISQEHLLCEAKYILKKKHKKKHKHPSTLTRLPPKTKTHIFSCLHILNLSAALQHWINHILFRIGWNLASLVL